jgi:shikimate kinase
MKLYLIGLLGSGKSVLGKKIALSVKLPLIDLDDVLEAQEGMKVSEIFSVKGEAYFRTIEAAALRKQSEAHEFVMATGGGTPCFHSNMNFIKETGVSIFLDTPVQEILKRLDGAQKKSRPLLERVPDDKIEQTLEKMLANRLPFYEQANFTVNGATANVWDILQLLHTKK